MIKTKDEFLNEIKDVADANNYEIVDIFLKGTNRRISYRCKKHLDILQESYFVRFKKGIECPYCKRENEYQTIKDSFSKRGYVSLSTIDDYDKNKLYYLCPNHYDQVQYTTWYNFKKGHGCKFCGHEKVSQALKHDYENVKADFQERGYELLEDKYINSTTKMRYRCLQHPTRELFMSYNDLMHGVSCPFCVGMGTSFPEQFIYYYIQKYYVDALNRKKIFGYEYDIIVPSLKLLIEYDGDLYHRSNDKDIKKEYTANNSGWHFLRIKEVNDNVLKAFPIIDGNIVFVFNQYGRRIDYMNKAVDLIFEYINKQFDLSTQCKKENDIYSKILHNCNKIQEENSIVNTHPDLVEEWDYAKNWPLTPEMFSKGSSYSPFWRCKQCNSSWSSIIANRTYLGRGCPFCNGGVSKSVDQLTLDGAYIQTFTSFANAGKAIGVTSKAISNACRGKTKICGGYLWRYHDDK